MIKHAAHLIALLLLFSQAAKGQVQGTVRPLETIPPQTSPSQATPYQAGPVQTVPPLPGQTHSYQGGQVYDQPSLDADVYGQYPDSASSRAIVCRMQWGIRAMPLPDYLRLDQLGLLPYQGLLVTSVEPYSPAHRAGLQAGQLILDVDGVMVDSRRGLPSLRKSCTLTVLTNSGTVGLQVHPADRHDLPHNALMPPRIEAWLQNPFALSGLSRTALRPNSCIRSLSMNRVGDEFICSALVNGDNGLRRLRLEGTREEIECQLRELAPEVQRALRPQFGF